MAKVMSPKCVLVFKCNETNAAQTMLIQSSLLALGMENSYGARINFYLEKFPCKR